MFLLLVAVAAFVLGRLSASVKVVGFRAKLDDPGGAAPRDVPLFERGVNRRQAVLFLSAAAFIKGKGPHIFIVSKSCGGGEGAKEQSAFYSRIP